MPTYLLYDQCCCVKAITTIYAAVSTALEKHHVCALVQGTGMNLRTPIQGMFAYPTLVLFCEGKAGIAAAKALIEATPDSGGLNFPLRQDVRMYYRVSAQHAFWLWTG